MVVAEMTRHEIDLQQSDDADLLVEVSDESLEVACGLMQGSPTLAFGSYCFTCRPHLQRNEQRLAIISSPLQS
jgi:hypothetical protein